MPCGHSTTGYHKLNYFNVYNICGDGCANDFYLVILVMLYDLLLPLPV